DLVIVLPASWLPLVADYTRFSRGRRSAFWGSGLGYLAPNAWLYALGALLVLSQHLPSDPQQGPRVLLTTIAGSGLARGLALLAPGCLPRARFPAGRHRRVAGRVRGVPVAPAHRALLVDGLRRSRAPRRRPRRRFAAELRGRVRAGRDRARADAPCTPGRGA